MASPFFVIAVHRGHPDYHPSQPMVWCGYSGQYRTHIWKNGQAGLKEAVRFCRLEDANHAGVSGPNYQQVDCNKLPDRGILILKCEDDDGKPTH